MKNQIHETQEGLMISRRRLLKAGMFGVGALAASQLPGCVDKGQRAAQGRISDIKCARCGEIRPDPK